MTKNSAQYITRKDVEEIVGNAVAEILNVLSPPIQELQEDVKQLKVDVKELQEDVGDLSLTTSRIERKLDAEIERNDRQDLAIEKLQRKFA